VLGTLDQPGLRQPGEQPGAGVVVGEQVGATVVQQVVPEQQQPDLQEGPGLGAVRDLVPGDGPGIGGDVGQDRGQVVVGRRVVSGRTDASSV
jgi:hypothetical protein